MKKSFWPIYLALSMAGAQQQPPKPPAITDALKIAYFKANSEFLTARSQAEQASQVAQQKQAALQEAAKAITEACGKEFTPTMDAAVEPACVEKPKADATKEKK